MGEALLLATVVHLAFDEEGAGALERHRQACVLASAVDGDERGVEVAARGLEEPAAACADGERPRGRRAAGRRARAARRSLRARRLAQGERHLGAVAVEAEAQRVARADRHRERRGRLELLARLDELSGRERDEAEDLPVQDRDDEVAGLEREPEALAGAPRASSTRPWSASTRAMPRSANAGQSSPPSRS